MLYLILCILVIVVITIIANVHNIITWRSTLRLLYQKPYWIVQKKFLKWWVTGTANGQPVVYNSERHARLFVRTHWKTKQRRRGKRPTWTVKNLDKYLDN